jgi:D-alanine-D-alanine ligase
MTLSILTLVGASTTPELAELSELYARGAVDALDADYHFTTLHLSPDGAWRLIEGLSAETLRLATPMSFAEVVCELANRRFDIGLPQMFCHHGMTAGRALFELLDLPFIGNAPVAMGLTADKAMARAVVSAAGVRVPQGVRVQPGETPGDLPPLPVIVKPVASDNSDGVSLVREASQLKAALQTAFAEGGDALIETFIPPGRELRCAVIEREGRLQGLPPEEYPVNTERPVRTKADKLGQDDDGALALMAKTQDAAWIIAADDPVIPELHAASLAAYRALGCRHYGLFDFRVDDQGQAWFLEAGLYCSFSPQSVVIAMAEAAGITLAELFEGFVADELPPVELPLKSAARPVVIEAV